MTARPVDPAVSHLLDQREAQGLPRHVEDRAALAQVAAVVTHAASTPPPRSAAA